MKEKHFLFMILFIMFLLLSVMTILILEGQVRARQRFSLMEYEKLMYSYYQNYLDGSFTNDELAIDDVTMPEDVTGVGLYNFYGRELFHYGEAVDNVEEDSYGFMPVFDKQRRSVIIIRDFLNPFVPNSKDNPLFDNIISRSYTKAMNESEETKQTMVRYFYLSVKDDYMFSLLLLFRGMQVVFTLLILFIVLLIGRLFLWNMKYRKQIEEQERLVLLGAASRTLTHEIKNPLSSIRLQSTIIKRSGCGLHEEALNVINEEVERLSHLSGRISDYLRQPEGNPESCELSALVRRCLIRFSERIPGIEKTPLPELTIRIDPDRFRSVLDNLINNALESGSDPSDIRVCLEQKGHDALLTVADRGNGIKEDQQDQLFNPYFTTKSRGTGIGLSIVHSFVKAAGGQIQINSKSGEGTEVLLRFPLGRSGA